MPASRLPESQGRLQPVAGNSMASQVEGTRTPSRLSPVWWIQARRALEAGWGYPAHTMQVPRAQRGTTCFGEP